MEKEKIPQPLVWEDWGEAEPLNYSALPPDVMENSAEDPKRPWYRNGFIGPEMHKRCNRCGEHKHHAMFSSFSRSSDGIQYTCKVCRNRITKARIENDILYKQRLRKRNAARMTSRYRSDPEYRKKILVKCKIYRMKLDPAKLKIAHRKGKFVKYGITEEIFHELKSHQGDQCAICKRSDKRFHVDHDHETGEVRGALCESCNRALGAFGDNIEGIESVLKYLNETPYSKFKSHTNGDVLPARVPSASCCACPVEVW